MKVDFLKKRAGEFLQGVEYYLNRGSYNLAAFNLEQAAQLYLKYYLFLRIKDYPKTHSLEELLKELAKAYPQQKPKINRILEEGASVIGDLEQAYLTSRYLPVEFSENRIKKMEKLVIELVKFLSKI